MRILTVFRYMSVYKRTMFRSFSIWFLFSSVERSDLRWWYHVYYPFISYRTFKAYAEEKKIPMPMKTSSKNGNFKRMEVYNRFHFSVYDFWVNLKWREVNFVAAVALLLPHLLEVGEINILSMKFRKGNAEEEEGRKNERSSLKMNIIVKILFLAKYQRFKA